MIFLFSANFDSVERGAHFESFCSPCKSLTANARQVASPQALQLVLGSQP